MDIVTTINNTFTAADIALFYLILSSLVQALPEPIPADGKLYVIAYRFAHTVVANWKPASKKFEARR
jgi:hypothetical protein